MRSGCGVGLERFPVLAGDTCFSQDGEQKLSADVALMWIRKDDPYTSTLHVLMTLASIRAIISQTLQVGDQLPSLDGANFSASSIRLWVGKSNPINFGEFFVLSDPDEKPILQD